MKKLLFPEYERTFAGIRWINILLRTIHLIGIAGCGAALFNQMPLLSVLPYLQLTFVSGVFMVLLAIWGNGIWLVQARGVATLTKVTILGYAMTSGSDEHRFFACLFVIIVAGIVSHAPGAIRYYRVIPYRRNL